MHRLPVAPSLMALLALGVTGCSVEDGSRDGAIPTVQDSAGVTVVRQRIDPERTVELVEEWRVGDADGDNGVFLFRPRSGRFGPDGEVYLLDAGNHLVRVFAPGGALLRSFGSHGEGPGEFSQLALTMDVSDSLVVVMDAGRRIHTFRHDGTLVGTVAMGPALPPGSYAGAPSGVAGRWYLPVTRSFAGADRERIPGQPTELFTFHPTGGIGGATGLAWSASVEERVVGAMGWILYPLFIQHPRYFFDAEGRMHGAFHQDYGWEVRGLDGTLLRRVLNDWERSPVTEDDLERYEDGRRQACREQPNSECQRYLTEALPVQLTMTPPEHKAAVYQFHGSPRGDLLVLREDTGYDPVDGFLFKRYDLFDPDGLFLGTFTRPGGFRVIGMDSERIIAVERDLLGVESVVVYKVVLPS